MVTIKQRLDNDDHYESGNVIEYLVIHDTGNSTDSDEGNANYFCTGSRGASAHYFVDNDSITQIVLDKDGSYHCGDGHNLYGINNHNSIGIEMCRVNNQVTEITKNNTIDLIKMLMAKYNVPIQRVVRHYDASKKLCPSSLSANNWAKWYEFKARLSTPVQVPVSSTPTPTTIVYRVRKSWTDIKSQIGAYSLLDNAKDAVNKNAGYSIFDSNGVCVYPVIISQPTPVATSNLLQKGNKGDTVKVLQTKLNTFGYGLSADGDFGQNTYNAVVDFQSKHGLTADGVVGDKTMAELSKTQEKYGVVTASTLNARDGAGANFPVLGQLSKGTRVKIYSHVEGWYNIYYGSHGAWVSDKYIQI